MKLKFLLEVDTRGSYGVKEKKEIESIMFLLEKESVPNKYNYSL